MRADITHNTKQNTSIPNELIAKTAIYNITYTQYGLS